VVKEYKQGDHILLERNAKYWRWQSAKAQGPDEVRLVVQQNRDVELSKFLNGDLHLINTVDAENYNRILQQQPKSVVDAGPSLDEDFLWFNQSPKAKIAEYKRAWFTSQAFRNAVSSAINRDDLVRIAFGGHGQPAVGPVSEGNAYWFNRALKPHAFNRALAMQKLRQDGFTERDGKLYDRGGHPVEFSIITNAGNKAREKMGLLIQQDLAAVGIGVKVVTLDFPSLIERMTRSLDYEACILGFTNVEVDPMTQMNVWLSSSENHQWNPSQATPSTPWEAEIDRLMRVQASTNDVKARKKAFDRVQQIVWEQEPFIYLVTKHTLSAVGPAVKNAKVSKIWPQTFWNADELQVEQK
jgi:peptide/nickel transport system substrate-binding protein